VNLFITVQPKRPAQTHPFTGVTFHLDTAPQKGTILIVRIPITQSRNHPMTCISIFDDPIIPRQGLRLTLETEADLSTSRAGAIAVAAHKGLL
jgi:hypothetical protein